MSLFLVATFFFCPSRKTTVAGVEPPSARPHSARWTAGIYAAVRFESGSAVSGEHSSHHSVHRYVFVLPSSSSHTPPCERTPLEENMSAMEPLESNSLGRAVERNCVTPLDRAVELQVSCMALGRNCWIQPLLTAVQLFDTIVERNRWTDP